LSVESIRDQATYAVMPNPFSANWAAQKAEPVSAQPSQDAKTATTGEAAASGVYLDATQRLAHATLLALKQQVNLSGKVNLEASPATNSLSSTVPSSLTSSGSMDTLAHLPLQNRSAVYSSTGTYTHRPKANAAVNAALTLNSLNDLPAFQTFMSQMFETLKTVNLTPSTKERINSLDKNSVTGLVAPFNNYYHQGYEQTSFDLLRSKLNYLADQTQKALALPSPSVTPKTSLTSAQNTPEFSKDSPSAPPANKDNQVTDPHIQKLNESYNNLVASLQGNIGASSLASFVQNLQHQAHGFSDSGNMVNTSA